MGWSRLGCLKVLKGGREEGGKRKGREGKREEEGKREGGKREGRGREDRLGILFFHEYYSLMRFKELMEHIVSYYCSVVPYAKIPFEKRGAEFYDHVLESVKEDYVACLRLLKEVRGGERGRREGERGGRRKEEGYGEEEPKFCSISTEPSFMITCWNP
jgi:hypothetical protein